MHQGVIDVKRQKIFTYLTNFKDFYLAGGTALALQIAHRISIDFDLFSEKEIPKNLLIKAKRVFAGEKIAVSVNNRDELTIFVNNIKITFLKYPFPVLRKLVSYQGISLLSVQEIAATKTYVIGRRGSYRDYIDLYFIFKEQHVSLEETLRLAEKKYKNEFNSRLFLEQLLYLEDVGDEKIMFLKTKVNKEDLSKFFRKEISKICL